MYSKDEQFIGYLVQKNPRVSITSLMKLSYLIDLVAVKQLGRKITNFEYRRYNFGPFDKAVYECTEHLTDDNVLILTAEYSSRGDEYWVYNFNFNEHIGDFSTDQLSEEEIEIIDEVLEELSGYGARALTEVAYKTKPMMEKGATIGGDEHFNEILDLSQ